MLVVVRAGVEVPRHTFTVSRKSSLTVFRILQLDDMERVGRLRHESDSALVDDTVEAEYASPFDKMHDIREALLLCSCRSCLRQ